MRIFLDTNISIDLLGDRELIERWEIIDE